MSNAQKPDGSDLINKLLTDQVVNGEERSEVAPGLMKKFSQLGQQPEAIHEQDALPESEQVVQDPAFEAESGDHISAYPELADHMSTQRKQGMFSRLRSKLLQLNDPLNHAGAEGEIDEAANWPRQIQIGFMTEVKKKDLLRYIGEWVSDNATSKSACFYQILPYNGGLAYEIQEGGSGSGVLKSAIETLSRHSEVIIPSSERYLQLSIKPSGFSSYLLDEFETKLPSPELVFKDQLKPVFSRHHGLMVAGLLSALLGVATICSAWFMVYGVYNKEKVPVYANAHYELPSQQLRKVSDVLNQPNSYLDRLEFKGDKWNLIIKKSLSVASPPQAPALNPLPVVDPALAEIQNSLKEAGK